MKVGSHLEIIVDSGGITERHRSSVTFPYSVMILETISLVLLPVFLSS